MWHVESLSSLIGILSLEWAVLPPGNKRAAIPDDATAITMQASDLTLAKISLYKNVLPVPPGPSIKNKLLPSPLKKTKLRNS